MHTLRYMSRRDGTMTDTVGRVFQPCGPLRFCDCKSRRFLCEDFILIVRQTQLFSLMILSGNNEEAVRCAGSAALLFRATSVHQGCCGALTLRSSAASNLRLGLPRPAWQICFRCCTPTVSLRDLPHLRLQRMYRGVIACRLVLRFFNLNCPQSRSFVCGAIISHGRCMQSLSCCTVQLHTIQLHVDAHSDIAPRGEGSSGPVPKT